MIIVSQDKTKTTESVELWIEELWESTEFERRLFYIKNSIGTLGTYKTEERAKEILQEIIKLYTKCEYERGEYCYKAYDVPKVYEMPEE